MKPLLFFIGTLIVPVAIIGTIVYLLTGSGQTIDDGIGMGLAILFFMIWIVWGELLGTLTALQLTLW